jgi:hypothetical protein
MTKSRNILPPRRRWTDAEDATLRREFPHRRTTEVARMLRRALAATYQRAYKLGLNKSAEYLASPAACRLDGVRGGSTRFKPGQVSWNKGTNWTAGGKSAETRFRPGSTPHNVVPVGSLRVNADGYLDEKVYTGRGVRNWVAYHRLAWERANGPVPADHVVVFRPGRQTVNADDITLDALELVTRVELMRRNSYHNRYSKEVGLAIQLRGAVIRQINRRTQKHEDDDIRSA